MIYSLMSTVDPPWDPRVGSAIPWWSTVIRQDNTNVWYGYGDGQPHGDGNGYGGGDEQSPAMSYMDFDGDGGLIDQQDDP
jgi:hypothetical protein